MSAETVLLLLLLLAQPGQKLWAQGRHLLGEKCPLALQCPCLLIPANSKCLWDGGGVTEDGFPVRGSFTFHHFQL